MVNARQCAKSTWLKLVAGAVAAAALITAPAQAQSLIRDAEIEATLRHYSDPIFSAAGVAPKDVSIYLVQDPALNAFVAGGQNMFLHTGLIMEADTPNQLKGVIAHETGHIAGGHLTRSRESMRQAMAPAIMAIGLGLLAIAAGAPDAGAAIISGSQQFAYADFVRHNRTQESAADQAAVTYLEALGQSPEGLVEFFEEFRYQEVMSEAKRYAYFRTHPLSGERIEALRTRVTTSPHRAATDSAEDVARFDMMKAKLFGFLETPQRTFARFPDSDTSAPARYARAIAACGCGVAGRQPDVARAERELQALLAGDPDNPYFNELMGQVYFENARAKESLPFFRTSAAKAPESALLQINLARAVMAAEGKAGAAEAVRLLEGAVKLEPDNPFAWSELANAYALEDRQGMALLASAEKAFGISNYPEARSFAERAKRALEERTPAWQRASDIANAAEIELRTGRRG